MPIYKYRCECGEERDEIRTIAQREDDVICKCGKKMKLQICNTKFIIHGHSYDNTYNKKKMIDVEA